MNSSKTTNKTYSDAIKQASQNADEQFTQLPLFRIATLTIPLLHSDHTVTMHPTPCVIANDTAYYSTTDGIRHAIPLDQIDSKNISYIDEETISDLSKTHDLPGMMNKINDILTDDAENIDYRMI